MSTAPEKTNALIDSGVILQCPIFCMAFSMRPAILLTCFSLSGLVDPSELLANIEAQILKAKEESMSRKEIMDRINKWLAACDDENWLQEYNQVTPLT